MKSAASGKSGITRKISFGVLFIMAILVPLLNAGLLSAAGPGDRMNRTVPGTVKKAGGSLITVKTESGTTRYVTRKQISKKGMSGLAPGDRVVLVLDSGNLLVDIYSRGISSLRGTIETIRNSDNLLTVRLANGRIRDYELKENVRPKLVQIRKGDLITFEVDQEDRIMDVRVN